MDVKNRKLLLLTVYGWMVSFNVSAGDLDSTKKTPKGGDAYFEYVIGQEESQLKPYVTCLGAKGEECLMRTAKSLPQPAVTKPKVIIEQASYDGRVYFDFAKSKLSETELSKLEGFAEKLKQTESQIKLRAFTDPVGGIRSKANIRLAKARAMSVKNHLIKMGVKANRITTEYNPPCCVTAGVTASSPEQERRLLRVVEVSY